MRIHYLQHVAFEGSGCIQNWAEKHNHSLSSTKLYKNNSLPSVDDIDWLIILGGPMGIYEEDKYPWIKQTKDFIRKTIELEKTVIGICLGAQFIASALGEKVYKNKEPELGWFPLSIPRKEHPIFKNFDTSLPVFHWHGDTFDLPEGATHLAETPACKNQAFLYKKNVLGLQFHLEVTEEGLHEMSAAIKNSYSPSNYVQSYEDIISAKQHIPECNKYLYFILDYFSRLEN